MEKQDVERKEKSGTDASKMDKGDHDDDNAFPALRSRVITPVELEIGQIIYVPSAPISTAMPERRPRIPSDRRGSPEENERRGVTEGGSEDNAEKGTTSEDGASSSMGRGVDIQIEELTTEMLTSQGETEDVQKQKEEEGEGLVGVQAVIEEEMTRDVFFDAYQENPMGERTRAKMDDDDETREKDIDEKGCDDNDDEDEYIQSVSDGEGEANAELSDGDDDSQWYHADTFPLRTYKQNYFNDLSRYVHLTTKRLENWELDGTDSSLTGSAYGQKWGQDDESSIVSDICSPRPDAKHQRVGPSMTRFRSQMPKFSTRVNIYKKQSSQAANQLHAPHNYPQLATTTNTMNCVKIDVDDNENDVDDGDDGVVDEKLLAETSMTLQCLSPGYFLDDYSDVTPRIEKGELRPRVKVNGDVVDGIPNGDATPRIYNGIEDGVSAPF